MDHNGEAGRGVQYPFIQPQPGEYVAQWEAAKLEPWKMVIRQLFEYLREDSAVPLAQISTEFIPFPDYGGGHGYSIFENSVACAKWLRETWNAE